MGYTAEGVQSDSQNSALVDVGNGACEEELLCWCDLRPIYIEEKKTLPPATQPTITAGAHMGATAGVYFRYLRSMLYSLSERPCTRVHGLILETLKDKSLKRPSWTGRHCGSKERPYESWLEVIEWQFCGHQKGKTDQIGKNGDIDMSTGGPSEECKTNHWPFLQLGEGSGPNFSATSRTPL